jgi:hypothetical protein
MVMVSVSVEPRIIMHRRRVLEMGAVAAVLPFAGCAAGPAGPTPAGPSAAPNKGEAPGGAAKVGEAGAAPSADSGPSPAPAETATSAAQDPPKAAEPPPPALSRVIARVGKNHGHELQIPFADVLAGAEKKYEMAGSSGHRHSVTLSAADMKSLLAGQVLRTQSSKGLHAHRVVVRCAPPVDPPEWVSVCSAEFSGKDEHEVIIPAADMAAKVTRSYEVQGLAGHSHTIEVTAADFQKLEKGEGVSVRTSRDETDAHLHVVFVQHRPARKG